MKRVRDRELVLRRQRSLERRRRRKRDIPHSVRQSRRQHALPAPQTGVLEAGASPNEPWTSRLLAPEVLSIVSAPDETLGFFSTLDRLLRARSSVLVDLTNVRTLQYDALVVLLSTVKRFSLAGVPFYGNYPSDAEADAKLRRSGFFDALANGSPRQADVSTSFYSHHDSGVDAPLTAGVILRTTERIWGEPRRCQRVQSVLIELMQNTNNHAEPRKPGEQMWWLSVDTSNNDERALFAFVDFGVGVLRSLDGKASHSPFYQWRRRLAEVFGSSDDPDLISRILGGDLHRIAKIEYYRGKGLPGISQICAEGGIANLRIVTNKVFADVSAGTFQKLRYPFTGTLVYWELGRENPSSPEVEQ